MLKNGAISNEDMCLISNNPNEEHSAVAAHSCVDAISIGDGRELWYYQKSYEISTFINNYCMQSCKDSQEGESNLEIIDCSNVVKFNDNRQKWIMDGSGKIRHLKDMDKCISLTGNELEVQNRAKIEASSTMDDGRHSIQNAIDGLLINNYFINFFFFI